MQWNLTHLSSSLLGLLRETPQHSEPQAHVAHIRQAMLDSMAVFLGHGQPRPWVWRRVEQANDIQSLWYLRCDVMQMLSHQCGETLAGAQVRTLTRLFGGHLPRAQFASSQRQR